MGVVRTDAAHWEPLTGVWYIWYIRGQPCVKGNRKTTDKQGVATFLGPAGSTGG